MTTIPLVPLPPLAPLTSSSEPSLQHQHHHYSEFASWLIPSRILIGESPSPPEDRNATSHRIHSLCHSAKCRTFVCLQAEVPPQTLGAIVARGGYEDWTRDKTRKVGPTYYYHVRKRVEVDEKVDYVHYGMRKRGGKGEMMRSMESLKELMEELKRRVCQGEVIYLHAGEGNDERTSLVASGLLGWLYPSMGVVEAVKRTALYYDLQRRSLGLGKERVKEVQVKEFCPLRMFEEGDGTVCDLLSLREEEGIQEKEEEKEEEEVVEVEISNLECVSSLSKEDMLSLSDCSMSSLSMPDDFMMMEDGEEESVVFSVDKLDGGRSLNNFDVKKEKNVHEFTTAGVVINDSTKPLDDDNDFYSGSLQETTKSKHGLSLATTTTASNSASQEIESNDESAFHTTVPSTRRRGEEEEEKKEDDVTNQPSEYHVLRRQRRSQQLTKNNEIVVNIRQVRYSSTRVQEIKSKLRSMESQYMRVIGD